MNRLQELLKDAEKVLEQNPVQPAPSGEWEEYNHAYIAAEESLYMIEQALEAVGSCEDCRYSFIQHNNLQCTELNRVVWNDWYCADYERRLENED